MSPASDITTEASGPISLEVQAERLGRAEDLQLESLETDIELRTMFGKVLLGIAIVVNLATITLVTLTGLGLTRLSDKLLITLISSTVAELAGLVLVVAKYLFPAAPLSREVRRTRRLPRASTRTRRRAPALDLRENVGRRNRNARPGP
jgi:hypothetical protein